MQENYLKTDELVRAPGKILISGEYALLNGARGYSIPTQKGLKLKIEKKSQYNTNQLVNWISKDFNNKIFFNKVYSKNLLRKKIEPDDELTLKISKILYDLNYFENLSYTFKSQVEYPISWGIGSSSALIACVLKLCGISPIDFYRKLCNEESYSGSGYDLFTSYEEKPLIFRNINNTITFHTKRLQDSLKKYIYFVYSGKKVKTENEIYKFKQKTKFSFQEILEINNLTYKLTNTNNLNDFEEIIKKHEEIISSKINKKKVQDQFKDYWGQMKSLGAWGGDFLLVTSKRSSKTTKNYFKKKGYEYIFSYEEFIA